MAAGPHAVRLLEKRGMNTQVALPLLDSKAAETQPIQSLFEVLLECHRVVSHDNVDIGGQRRKRFELRRYGRAIFLH